MTEGTPKDTVPPPVDLVPTLVGAWITAKSETDRTLVGLSAGGVGLLVGLLVVVTERLDPLWPYWLALGSFVLALCSGLMVLVLNGRLLEITIHDLTTAQQSWTKKALTGLSVVVAVLFALGVVVSAWVGYSAATADAVFNYSQFRTSTGGPMKNKALRPSDIRIKPASGPTETRGLQNLPSLLQTLAEAQQSGHAPQPAPPPQGGTEGAGLARPAAGKGGTPSQRLTGD
jgi:hypothetical protein